jgi:protease IV
VRKRKRWIVLGIIVVLVIVGVVVARREPYIVPGSYLVVDIGGTYTEAPPAGLVSQLVDSSQQVLTDLLLELRKATVDTRLQGVIVKVAPIDMDFAQVQELRAALQGLKAAGKRVVAWVSGEGDSGNHEYYLASVADRVYFTENTILPLLGLRATAIFLGGVWEKIDIDMQVEQMKEYKTFGDFLGRKSMSEAHREMTNSLLDSVHEQLLTDIAGARGLPTTLVRAFIDAPTLTSEDYLTAGLIDGIVSFDQLVEEVVVTPERLVSLDTYRGVKAASVGLVGGPKIAVVYGVGAVQSGESDWGVTGEAMGANTIIKAFKEAVDDDDIRAIVFRIDSPGGSALASDLIWQAVSHAKKTKPVVVSMAGVAASGGYYIACSATKIVAQPATLTGSIGIVFSLPNIQGLLDKLGITTETLERGRFARLFDPSKGWSAEERQQVQRLLATLYRTFTRRVAEGRGLNVDEVDRIGRGRVWTGAQAKDLGLVDQLGGLDTALRVAREEAGIPADMGLQLVFYPKPKHLLETLLERLAGQVKMAMLLPSPLRELRRWTTAFDGADDGPRFLMPVWLRIK